MSIFQLFGRPQAAHVFHRAGKVPEPGAESLEMLKGQDGRRDQDGHLLGIADGLEGGPDGHFRLSETHIPAHQAVHRTIVLHVLLDRPGRLLLVGRIFIHEGGF